MHFARELRNVATHQLPYIITSNDAKLVQQILVDVLAWIHNDKTREQWYAILDRFELSVKRLESARLDGETAEFVIFELCSTLETALNLKLHSLGIASESRDLFSRLERAVAAGIDARSPAWGDVVAIRNTLAHRLSHPSQKDWIRVRSQLDELRKTLLKLQPKFGPAPQ